MARHHWCINYWPRASWMPRTLLAIRRWHHVMPWHRSDESTVKQIEEKITEANCALLFFDGSDEPMECAWLEMVQRWTPALWWCNRLIQSFFFHSATDEFFEPIQQFSFCWFSFHPWLYTIFGARSFLCAHRRGEWNETKTERRIKRNHR